MSKNNTIKNPKIYVQNVEVKFFWSKSKTFFWTQMHLLRSQKNSKEVENQERKEKLLSIVQYCILKNPY